MTKLLSAGPNTPLMTYELLHQTPLGPQHITAAKDITLLVPGTFERREDLTVKVGDGVRTGQKISPFGPAGAYAVSSVTGTIRAIAPMSGDYGRRYTALTITKAPAEQTDDAFSGQAPTLETLLAFLRAAPGNPPLHLFDGAEPAVHTILVCGLDADLLVATNQYVIKAELAAVARGIAILKEATGVPTVVIVVPRDLVQGFGHTGATALKAVDPIYPAANPHLIIHRLFGQEVPMGKSPADLGFALFSAESVAAIGKAFDTGRLPLDKTFTLVDKQGHKSILSARIGTPVADVLAAAGITTADRDRIIAGGPMTGAAVYSEEMPIRADTDALLVQAAGSFALTSDYPCVNCGECVRVCPARMQVNMLVRFLEAGQYSNAADLYDLDACIECGLCSYVCVAHIPIFQYIKLAKYELSRLNAAEAPNG